MVCINNAGSWSADLEIFKVSLSDSMLVIKGLDCWLLDKVIKHASNGKWLIGIDGKYDIYDLVSMPGNKIKLINTIGVLTCDVSEVELKAKVVYTFESNT